MKIALILSIAANVVLAAVAVVVFIAGRQAIADQQADHDAAVAIYQDTIREYEAQADAWMIAETERSRASTDALREQLEQEEAEFLRRGGRIGGSGGG